jgi:hypothetical protein
VIAIVHVKRVQVGAREYKWVRHFGHAVVTLDLEGFAGGRDFGCVGLGGAEGCEGPGAKAGH